MTEAQLLKIVDGGLDLSSYTILERLYENKPVDALIKKLIWCEGVLEVKGLIKDRKVTDTGRNFILSVVGKTMNINDLAREYCEVFPDIKLPSGKYFKAEPQDVVEKLKKFHKDYGYSFDVILEAAKAYVEHAESVDYQFIRTSLWFIHKKGEGSDLANWCRDIVTGEKRVSKPLHRLL